MAIAWWPIRILLRVAAGLLVVGATMAGAVGARGAAEPSRTLIDAAMLLHFPAKPHSGFSAAIAHAGRIVFADGFGYRDDGTPDRFIPADHNYYGLAVARPPARRVRADARTIYEIGSLTKAFTAAAILRLVDQHRCSLDDAVGRYAPEFRDPRLTLRILLNQRSGLPDHNTLVFIARVRAAARRPDGSIDDVQVSRAIAAEPPEFAPGTRFAYSNANYFVLGTIVERISGESLATFLEREFFGPLGLRRTAFARPASEDDVAVGYRVDEHQAVFRAYPWDLAWAGGAGGLTSTAEDVARFDMDLQAGRVLAPESLTQMWHGLDAGVGQGAYAMGWVEDAIGSHRYLWHNGEVGGFHAVNVIFPNDDLAFAILTNNQDAQPEALVPGIAALYFPVTGIDRIVPRSAIVLIEASLAIALGAFAIAIVAVVTLRRWIVVGIVVAVLALVLGLLLPSYLGYVFGGAVALVPIAGYVLSVRFARGRRGPEPGP
jgi:CubicO group peptidase (beta-lactamase class C family)